MIALNIIQTSFRARTPLHPSFIDFDTRGSSKLCALSLCRSKSEDSSSESEASPPQGDPRKQELLAKIAMLQAEKLRLTDYLDQRSSYLTQFAEDATAEIDAVGENALKDLDEASARIMENMESRIQAFEESSQMNKQDIARREKELADFEGEIEQGRNEGLFFQSLRQRAPVEKAKAIEEMKKISDVAEENAASKTRRNIYLALIGLLAIAIANSLLSSLDWRKIAVLGAILFPLLSQFFYERKMSSGSEKHDEANRDEEEK